MNKISTAHTLAFWKRPLAAVALPFLCGAFLSACLSSLWIAFLIITAIMTAACFSLPKKTSRFVFALSVFRDTAQRDLSGCTPRIAADAGRTYYYR